MLLKKLTLRGFKSFAQKSELFFDVPVTAIVGPNGSGKSNVVEAIRFVLGEQSSKSLRSKSGPDLVFAGSKKIPKMSRASVVITFDNSKRNFKLSNVKNEKVSVDFDEIIISREVFSDGSNTYKINDHEVRLKDIHELIASVHIGSSGHHIISQGEADRLLNANAKERREMLEEALGLKLYHFRIKETSRKLDKTKENLQQSELLRREIAPHLRYLEREVKKIEESKQLRQELTEAYRYYFTQQSLLISQKLQTVTERKNELTVLRQNVARDLQTIESQQGTHEISDEEKKLQELDREMQQVIRTKAELARTSGRLEGMIEMAEQYSAPKEPGVIHIPQEVMMQAIQDVVTLVEQADSLEDISEIKKHLLRVRDIMHSLKEVEGVEEAPDQTDKIQKLQFEFDALKIKLDNTAQKQNELEAQAQELRLQVQQQSVAKQEGQREYFELKGQLQKVDSDLSMLALREDDVRYMQTSYDNERTESEALLGAHVVFEPVTELVLNWSHEIEMKKIERMKIRLETIGGGSGVDTIKEFEETKERDAFLLSEIEDLQSSIHSLELLVTDLEVKLTKEFLLGIEKISEQFQEFFGVLFGGGKASLKVVEVKKRRQKNEEGEYIEDEENGETGVDIDVSLPRKKVKDIEMLSGGERSLTSIALLFALSQVNPPPFLVLDETDAALDEANSTRYGDMITRLSEYSQLIVVTHNRETMSHAQTLYGVTMGTMECSQLLSVKIDDAMKWAK